jgi:hypothetical protein
MKDDTEASKRYLHSWLRRTAARVNEQRDVSVLGINSRLLPANIYDTAEEEDWERERKGEEEGEGAGRPPAACHRSFQYTVL